MTTFIHPHDWAGKFFETYSEEKTCRLMMERHGFVHQIRITTDLRYDQFKTLIDPHMTERWTLYTDRVTTTGSIGGLVEKSYLHVVGSTRLVDAVMAKMVAS